jgi:hypothetical protein
MMRTVFTALGLGCLLLASLAQAPVPDPLTRARRAYNERQFDAAISAAREALEVPASANAAGVVLARAHLERFRMGAESADMDGARAALAKVRPDLLSQPDRVEFLIGLGLSLFLDGCAEGCFSSAADFFDLALSAGTTLDVLSREALFEWWAGALDRQALYGPDDDRVPTYRRILDRAEGERSRDLNSTTAAYWITVAARGVGDFNRAWGAAVAGWVRAKYLGPRGEVLRNDLSRFVNDVLLPERAKQLVPESDPRPQLEQLRKQWNEITEKYK